ncbi:MAG TPA: hypothetical protein VM101_02395 [Flavitalea sp.]|nr:hypothetical protein [Flavitalea sp.]
MRHFLLPVIFISILFFIACGSHQQSQSTVHNNGKFNFAYLRYDSAAVEYRLDSIHNRGLEFQMILRDAGNNNTAFQLISYAFDTLRDYNNSWMPDTLSILDDSLPVNFTNRISLGNNEVTREQLLNVVRDENGKRFSYDYVMFVPVVEEVFNHVVYMLKAMKSNAQVPGSKMQMTSPMPPTRVWDF